MIRLALVFTAAQLLDLVTYLRAPQLEANPFVAGQPVEEVVAGKVAILAIGWCLVLLSYDWRRRGARGFLELALLLAIAVGAFGAGTNVATLSMVTAAEPAPRPTPELMGFPAWTVAPGSAAPDPTAPLASTVPPAATAGASSGRNLRGRASWVRASLGSRYLAARLPKGTRLRVCGPVGCVTGSVNDYGPSRRIHPDRIVDLSRANFARVCGSPAMGTCAVRVEVLR